MRRAWILVVAAAFLAHPAADAPADDGGPLVAKPASDTLLKAVAALARRGRRAEATEVLDVATKLRIAPADVDPARQAAERVLKTAKAAPPPIADAVKAVTAAAAALDASLAGAADDAARRTIAEQAVRLDESLAASHAALGHVRKDGRWVPSWMEPCLERRKLIQDAVRRARRMEVPVETVPSDLAILEQVTGKKGVAVQSGPYSIHSVHFPPERCARQLREVLRAAALVNWLRTGKLELPTVSAPRRLGFVANKPLYEKAIAAARAAGDLSERDAGWAPKWSGFIANSYLLFRGEGEHLIATHAVSHLIHHTLWSSDPPTGDIQPALDSGLLNWIHAGFIGVPMPGIGWIETTGGDGPAGGGKTSDDPVATREREEHLRFAKAGLVGSRAYMRWLVRRGEDPAWSRSMVDEPGKIRGPDLVKCTLVTEYLFETDRWESLRAETSGKPEDKSAFEAALGSLADFEARWREWLLAEDPLPSLLARLGEAPGGAKDEGTPAERAATAYLDGLRKHAVSKPQPALGVDRELSAGCRSHALYLVKHPEQAAAWPDAHEEYPDKEGFSPEGSRAGLSSVIMPGARAPEDAIDGWMATFYHRLPLIRPGLLRIGWGLEGGFGVLDSASFVAPESEPLVSIWPAAGATGVPLRFAPELPNPVEGEDQSKWGYPVTAQFFGHETDPDVRMALFRGARQTAQDTPVPCHFSTPSVPTNVKLAPGGSYCLIPKATLQPGTTYTVVAQGWPADGKPAGTTFTWTFTTGTK